MSRRSRLYILCTENGRTETDRRGSKTGGGKAHAKRLEWEEARDKKNMKKVSTEETDTRL